MSIISSVVVCYKLRSRENRLTQFVQERGASNAPGFLCLYIYQNGIYFWICQDLDAKLVCKYCIMPVRKEIQECDSTLELLRLERTKLTQDEFCFQCGIPRTTYQRWIRGGGPARPTIPQIKAIAKTLGIEKVEDLPDDFGIGLP